MKFRKPSRTDLAWIDRVEDGSNSSVPMVMVLDGERIYVRLMVPLTREAILDVATSGLAKSSGMFDKMNPND